ncbi:MAG: cation:proton antiporter [Puniceicoccales bacterium]|jgi:CPA2 family monovalent cation:H+ antiporter-2|nr:cation:proton antiporter [Puniceicoccales bacterium]
MGISFVQDIAIVLLSAGIAGVICRYAGLSVVVGYLLAGIVIGPNTPVEMITDEARINDLAQVGLVFVMFAIGLNLGLTKLARMGMGVIVATGLGAVFVFMFTQLLGQAMGWDYKQSLFAAAMLMVSSSAVIAKVLQELRLTHNKVAQKAMAITICEDLVAVAMLAILASVGGGDGEGFAGASAVGGMGSAFTKISSYVILILAVCLLVVPRLMRRLDMSGDPELRTVGISGVLLLLAVCAAQAGFSTALGAFLFGAIMAELPQRDFIEKSFESVRSIFSSLFFVSIGMMARPGDLFKAEVLALVCVLVCFAMFVRPLACGFALMLVGVPPHEARRGGLLLTPLGEFTFIIAQAAIAERIFPGYFYPVAIALSVCTVLFTPLVNRFADPILAFVSRVEPRWVARALLAYHAWLAQMGRRFSPGENTWRFVRPRLAQIAGEMLLVTGLLVFSGPLLAKIQGWVDGAAEGGGEGTALLSWLAAGKSLQWLFWGVVVGVVLMFLLSVVRNVWATTPVLAKGLASPALPRKMIAQGFNVVALVVLGCWLYSILPFELEAVSLGARVAILAGTAALVAIFSRRLIYWHSAWRVSMEAVLSGGAPVAPDNAHAVARQHLDLGLEAWAIHLQDCVLPDNAACAGKPLSELAIPTRFGGSIIEIERNGHSVLTPKPDMQLYPGDKVLLLGKDSELAATRKFLESRAPQAPSDETFNSVVLESCHVRKSPHSGRRLAELGITQATGVRLVGIQRGAVRITNPTGSDTIEEGDHLLLVGTLEQSRRFARWLDGGAREPAGN